MGDLLTRRTKRHDGHHGDRGAGSAGRSQGAHGMLSDHPPHGDGYPGPHHGREQPQGTAPLPKFGRRNGARLGKHAKQDFALLPKGFVLLAHGFKFVAGCLKSPLVLAHNRSVVSAHSTQQVTEVIFVDRKEIAADMPHWEFWKGVSGTRYARRRLSSPPLVLSAPDSTMLTNLVIAFLSVPDPYYRWTERQKRQREWSPP